MKQNITLIALILWTTALVSAQELYFEQELVNGVKNTPFGNCINQTQNKGVIIGRSSQFNSYDFVCGYLKTYVSKTKHPTPIVQIVSCIPKTIQKKTSTIYKGNCCGKVRITA